MKLKASALSFAIFVVFIIGIAMSSMLLLHGSSDQILLKHAIQKKLIHNAESGVYHYMMNSEEFESESNVCDLFGKSIDSVQLSSEYWGTLKIVHSKAFARKDTFTKSAFIGEKILKNDPTVLYLSDKNSPLSICGKTEIRGNVFLPKSGVKRAYIEGQNYNGEKLIYGKERQSERFLPDLSYDIKSLMKDPNFNQKELERIQFDELEADSVYKEFKSQGIELFSQSTIYLNEQFFSGKIRLRSSESIYIGREAVLKDVILIAPEVVIESGFKGNVQIFSSTVEVQKEVVLEYPSIVMLYGDSEEKGPELSIEDDVIFEGTIIAKGKQRAPAQVQIEKAQINGLVFNNGLTQTKGELNGSLYSSELILKTASSVYKNHLLNTKISMNDEVREQSFPNLFSRSKFNTVSKWLN